MRPHEVDELLEELLRSFRQFFCTSAFQEISSTAEEEKARQIATRARETLESLFQDQPEFSREFFSDETNGADINILTKMKEWANAEISRRPRGVHNYRYSAAADDLRGCKNIINFLTGSSQDNNQPVLWPFIKLIRFGEYASKA